MYGMGIFCFKHIQLVYCACQRKTCLKFQISKMKNGKTAETSRLVQIIVRQLGRQDYTLSYIW